MEDLLTAIQTVLKADRTLTALVAPENIVVSESEPKQILFPGIILAIEKLSETGHDDIYNVLVRLTIINPNMTNWDIFWRVHALLHKQGTTITDSNVAVHSIESTGTGSPKLSVKGWVLVTGYSVVVEVL